jgi:AcrR family transcriptional regulator
MAEPISLRERTRQAVRSELIRCGMDLFAIDGYESTTVAQIAQQAGMSERSFFRYFTSKGELALGSQEEVGRLVADTLAGRPSAEPAWLALRHAFEPVCRTIDGSQGRARRLVEMLHSTPELRAGQLRRQFEWTTLLAPGVAAHLPAGPPGDAEGRAVAVAGAAIMCYQVAQTRWLTRTGSKSMHGLLGEAMDAVAHAAPDEVRSGVSA